MAGYCGVSLALRQQRRGGGDELAVARGRTPIGQNRRVPQAGSDAVAAGRGAPVDRPGGDAVAVVDLLEPEAAVGQGTLDGLGVGYRLMGVWV